MPPGSCGALPSPSASPVASTRSALRPGWHWAGFRDQAASYLLPAIYAWSLMPIWELALPVSESDAPGERCGGRN
jgi:hypothetical protein